MPIAHTHYQLGTQVMQQTLGQVVVLMQLTSGQYFELNHAGGLTLKTLLNGGDADACANALCESFAIDHAQAKQDAQMLIEQLLQRGLIEHKNESEPIVLPRQNKSRRSGDTADKSRRSGDTADKSRRSGDTADK
jgi:Coenzyme PQQ synthesis protein D (PqqD)